MLNSKVAQPEPASRRKPGLVERIFETLLWQTRFLVLLAVIPSILGAAVLFIIASMDIFEVVNGTWHYYITGNRTVDIHETVVADIVGAVDIYLIAIVLLIFSLGTYKEISCLFPESSRRRIASLPTFSISLLSMSLKTRLLES